MSLLATTPQVTGQSTQTWTRRCSTLSQPDSIQVSLRPYFAKYPVHNDRILNHSLADATSSITYNQASPLTDIGFVAAYHDVDDLSLVPIEVIPQPTVTKTIDLEVSFDTADDGTNRAMFNQMTWNVPKVPGIFSALSLGENATADAAYGPLSYVIEYGDVVDLVIKNGDLGKHPLCVASRFDFNSRTWIDVGFAAICTDTSSRSWVGRRTIPLRTSLSILRWSRANRILSDETLLTSRPCTLRPFASLLTTRGFG